MIKNRPIVYLSTTNGFTSDFERALLLDIEAQQQIIKISLNLKIVSLY